MKVSAGGNFSRDNGHFKPSPSLSPCTNLTSALQKGCALYFSQLETSITGQVSEGLWDLIPTVH